LHFHRDKVLTPTHSADAIHDRSGPSRDSQQFDGTFAQIGCPTILLKAASRRKNPHHQLLPDMAEPVNTAALKETVMYHA
jgi:hypothetical protein